MSPTKLPRRKTPKRVYRLHVVLLDIEPRIWRTILVPGTLTLAKLDRVVQAAMGWTNSHLHEWRIEGQRYGVPDDDWDTPAELRDDRRYTAGSVLGEHVETFEYEYDFGDGWRHRVEVQARLAFDPERNGWPMCLAGANACPPEDVGGPFGYLDFLQAMRDSTHPEHLQNWLWNGGPFDPAAFSLNDANRAIQRIR